MGHEHWGSAGLLPAAPRALPQGQGGGLEALTTVLLSQPSPGPSPLPPTRTASCTWDQTELASHRGGAATQTSPFSGIRFFLTLSYKELDTPSSPPEL